jgi:hypothetical protein
MKKRTLLNLEVSALGFGCMGLSYGSLVSISLLMKVLLCFHPWPPLLRRSWTAKVPIGSGRSAIRNISADVRLSPKGSKILLNSSGAAFRVCARHFLCSADRAGINTREVAG